MPFAAGDSDVRSREFLASAVDDAIEADVVLKRVRSSHIVIVRILEADRQPAGLVALARDGLESGCHLNVGGRIGSSDGKWEPQISGIGAELRQSVPALGARIRDDFPAG